MQLVAQAESKRSYSGRWFGYEVFEHEGDFYLSIHTSMYEGIKRTSHWATEKVKMDSLTREGALQEAAKSVSTYAKSVLGTDKRVDMS